MGEKSVANLLAAIESSKERPLARVLTALGIDHVGFEVAEALSRHFRTIDAIMAASEEDLSQVPSIGPKIAASVAAYFANESNRAVVGKLRESGVRMADEERPEPGEQSLAGLRFVVTGRLSSFSRSQAEGRIKGRGRRGQRQREQADELPSGRGGRGLQARRRGEAGDKGHRRGRVRGDAGRKGRLSTT